MAGRRPTPIASKLVAGNTGKWALNKHEAKPKKDYPDVPLHFSDLMVVINKKTAHKEAFFWFIRKEDDTGLAELEHKAMKIDVDADGGFALSKKTS